MLNNNLGFDLDSMLTKNIGEDEVASKTEVKVNEAVDTKVVDDSQYISNDKDFMDNTPKEKPIYKVLNGKFKDWNAYYMGYNPDDKTVKVQIFNDSETVYRVVPTKVFNNSFRIVPKENQILCSCCGKKIVNPKSVGFLENVLKLENLPEEIKEVIKNKDVCTNCQDYKFKYEGIQMPLFEIYNKIKAQNELATLNEEVLNTKYCSVCGAILTKSDKEYLEMWSSKVSGEVLCSVHLLDKIKPKARQNRRRK